MNQDFSKERKRCNYLLNETDAAYHEAAIRFGLSDSCMIVLYTICDAGEADHQLRPAQAGSGQYSLSGKHRREKQDGSSHRQGKKAGRTDSRKSHCHRK